MCACTDWLTAFSRVRAMVWFGRVYEQSTFPYHEPAPNTQWRGRRLRLVDTAGIRRKGRWDYKDKLERLAVEEALRAVRYANVRPFPHVCVCAYWGRTLEGMTG